MYVAQSRSKVERNGLVFWMSYQVCGSVSPGLYPIPNLRIFQEIQVPIPATKVNNVTAVSAGSANRLLPTTPADFSSVLIGASVLARVSAIGDSNAEGIAAIVIGAGTDTLISKNAFSNTN